MLKGRYSTWGAFLSVGVSGFGLDYLPAGSSAPEPNSWHQSAPTNSWAAQDMPMDDSSTVLLDSFKVNFTVIGEVLKLSSGFVSRSSAV